MTRAWTPTVTATALVAWVMACGDGGTGPAPEPPNRAPLAVGAIPHQTVHVGDTATIDISVYFVDPDGDSLSYQVESSSDETATASVSGARVTVVAIAQGTATATVTATDPGGLSATHTFGVAIPNRGPLPVDSIPSLELVKGDSATLDVAGHFTDPDGDSLSYSVGTSDAGTATASVSGAEVTLAAIAQGTATVTVSATDPDGLSATQAFEVTVPNRAPVPVHSLPRLELFKGDTATLDIADYFTDPDGDTLFYELSNSDPETVAVILAGSLITLAGVAQGSATVTATATDPGGLAVDQALEVLVPNRAPLSVDSIPRLELIRGDSATFDVAGHFSDPDGDSLSYSVRTSDAGTATASVSGAQVTVAAIAQGSATISVIATDPGGLSATHRLGVAVHRPSLVVKFATCALSVPEGDTVVLEVVASAAPDTPVTVWYSLGADSDPATNDADQEDYTNDAQAAIEFAPGTTTATLRIGIDDDNDIEPVREVLVVTLDPPGAEADYQLGSPATATVTIEEGVCDRTSGVRDGIMRRLDASDCADIGGRQLTRIRYLPLCFEPGEPRCLLAHPLNALRPGDFQGLTGLRTLNLFDNNLSELSADMFLGLEALEQLWLSGNRLDSIGTGVLAGLSQLKQFHLDYSPLVKLPPGTFSGLSNLRYLSLGGNRLDSLPSNLFAGLVQLEELHLDRNRLTELPAGIFSGLSALQWVSLYGNPGAPFTLTLRLRRTDNEDLSAPGPGKVGIWIDEGAPFDMRVPLSALGGTLSADTVLVEAGDTLSAEVIVTRSPDVQSGTVVSLTAPTISSQDFQFGATDPIVLFPPIGNTVALSTLSASSPEGRSPVIEAILTPPPTSPLTLTYDLVVDDDTTTVDADESDFVGPVRDSLHVPAGTARISIGIAINDDDDIESPREVVVVSLNAPDSATGYGLGYPAQPAFRSALPSTTTTTSNRPGRLSSSR